VGSPSGRSTTRRAFLGGAAAVGAGQLLAGPLRAATAAGPEQCAPMPPGIRTDAIAITPSGRTIWTTDTTATTITAHRTRDLARGRSIDVGGAPVAIAIAPEAPIALVATAFYDHPGLAIVDLLTGDVTRLDVGPDPRAVAFTPDGRRAYVAGADGTLTKVDPGKRHVHDPIHVGAQPRDVAVTADGVLVSLHADAAVALVTGKRVRKIGTAEYPHQLAVAGTRALVTHSGAGERRVTLLDLERRRVKRRLSAGLEPAGVALARGATRAVVTASGTGKVAVVDLRTGRRRSRTVGGTPRGVAIAGTRAIVADAVTGQLTKVRARARPVARRSRPAPRRRSAPAPPCARPMPPVRRRHASPTS